MFLNSGDMPKDEFIRKVLERDARNIYRSQLLIVSQRIYVSGKDLKASRRKEGLQRRTGRLENSLIRPDFYMRSEGENFRLSLTYPLYIRFLDMRHKGNWKIYRKPIWGIMYNNAYRDIQFNYGKEINDWVDERLRAAFEKYKGK